MIEQIKKHISRYVEINDAEIDEIFSILIQKTFEKKEYLLKEGQICKSNYFLISDLIQHFPAFAQRVPQYMIAAYLGVSRETLC